MLFWSWHTSRAAFQHAHSLPVHRACYAAACQFAGLNQAGDPLKSDFQEQVYSCLTCAAACRSAHNSVAPT